MSINTHVRYTLACDKCGFYYRDGEKFAGIKVLEFIAKRDGWEIALSCNGRSYDCICPDCAKKEEVQNEIS